jgi:SAM-dependent methyltransferase
MTLLAPPRRFDPATPEMMDRPGQDARLLREDLLVLEKINRFLGGHRIALHYVRELFGTRNISRPLTILDLATGSADVPRSIVRWARANDVRLQITAVDANPEILRLAKESCVGWREIQIEQANLLSLPYPSDSFDIVLCALALHHFGESDVVAILGRIRDIARVGYLVNDLRRNRIAIWLSKLMARTIITNPIARFDAPASCERAFTVAELHELARRAGMYHFRVRRHPIFRMAVVGRKQMDNAPIS